MTRLLRRLFAMPRQADPVQQYQAGTAAFVAIIFLVAIRANLPTSEEDTRPGRQPQPMRGPSSSPAAAPSPPEDQGVGPDATPPEDQAVAPPDENA